MEFKLCRVCLDRTATISMFNKQDEVQYCVKIMKCVNVTIVEGDGFPDAICEGCASDLAVSYDFATRCEASDKALRCLDLLQTAEPEPDAKPPPEPIKPEPDGDPCLAPRDSDPEDSFCDEQFSHHKVKSEIKNERPEIYLKEKYAKSFSKKILPDHLRTRKLRVNTGPIQCQVCDRTLPCHSAYELHMRSHTNERPYMCDLCKKTFTNKYTLKNHIQRHYGLTKESNKNKIRQSDKRRNRPKIGPFQCATCGRMIQSYSAMENHMRTHTGEKPFTCELCGAKYKLKGALMRHMHCSHPESQPDPHKYTCEHCGKVFLAKSNIITHMRVHTGVKPYACAYCPLRFRQSSSRNRHQRRHTGEKPFACDTCGRSFHDRSLLNKHQSVHSVERKFACHVCDKAFKTKSTLKAHADGHGRKKLWVCSECGVAFTLKGNLKVHTARRHSERAGACAVCRKQCSDLAAHMRAHTGERPFACAQCGRRYGSARSLAHHAGFKHRDAHKFKCALDDCSRSFPTAAMLEFHVLKLHARTAPYECRHCARGFLRPCDLSRHLRLHHRDPTRVKSHFLRPDAAPE